MTATAASSQPPVCEACGYPVPIVSDPPSLAELIVAALREHPTEGLVVGSLARTVHRRRIDVEAELNRLADAGIVTRGEPRGVGRGSRGRAWTLDGAGTHLGRNMEPQEGTGAAPDPSRVDSLFLAAVATLAYGRRGDRIAAAFVLALLVVLALVFGRPEQSRGTRGRVDARVP